jgi:hypothetical protein
MLGDMRPDPGPVWTTTGVWLLGGWEGDLGAIGGRASDPCPAVEEEGADGAGSVPFS